MEAAAEVSGEGARTCPTGRQRRKGAQGPHKIKYTGGLLEQHQTFYRDGRTITRQNRFWDREMVCWPESEKVHLWKNFRKPEIQVGWPSQTQAAAGQGKQNYVWSRLSSHCRTL